MHIIFMVKKGKSVQTIFGSYDPEDYRHLVGDPPTDLNLYPNSPGNRLILNNVLFSAGKKKRGRRKQFTRLPVDFEHFNAPGKKTKSPLFHSESLVRPNYFAIAGDSGK